MEMEDGVTYAIIGVLYAQVWSDVHFEVLYLAKKFNSMFTKNPHFEDKRLNLCLHFPAQKPF